MSANLRHYRDIILKRLSHAIRLKMSIPLLFKAFLLASLILAPSACGVTPLPLAPNTETDLIPPFTSPSPTHVITAPLAVPSVSLLDEQPVLCAVGAESITLTRQHILALSERIGARQTGTSGEAQAAAYIESTFTALGYSPSVQPFSFTVAGRGKLTSKNSYVTKEGRSSRLIIVGAHYDSVSGSQGADDNASGVAVMLETARLIKGRSTPYTIRFVAFGAEEARMRGSTAYVEQLSAREIANVVVMINLDSLIAGDIAYVYGNEGERGKVRDWALDLARRTGIDLHTQTGENPLYPAGTTGDWGDSFPFSQAGIPYAYFEATNWNLGDKDGYVQVAGNYGEDGQIWHTPYDNLTYLDTNFPGRVDAHLNLFITILCQILTQFDLE